MRFSFVLWFLTVLGFAVLGFREDWIGVLTCSGSAHHERSAEWMIVARLPEFVRCSSPPASGTPPRQTGAGLTDSGSSTLLTTDKWKGSRDATERKYTSKRAPE
jgi:hypothetical protein